MKIKRNCTKPEIAGVSIPSPISMHMPKIAMKSNTLLAIILFSKNFPSALCFLLPFGTIELDCFREMIPIFMFLQSSEYKAKVPPAFNHYRYSSKDIQAQLNLEKHMRQVYVKQFREINAMTRFRREK